MSEDPNYLRLGFVIAVLGMAGISYWVVQERSQSTALTKNVAEAPARWLCRSRLRIHYRPASPQFRTQEPLPQRL